MSAAGTPAPVLPWRGAVLLLAIAQTVVWAGLYYSFAGLLARWEADLGWSKTELSAALTFALFASAAAAPFVGRLIDRGHGRTVLTFGAVVGAALLVLLSMVSTQWEFMVVWVLIGCAMATTLYEPCFAFLTHHFAMEAKKPITLVSLVAGFAGTLSFPTAFAIAEWAGWRMSLIVFAAMILLITVPLTWIATGRVAVAMPHQPAAPLPGRSAKATDVLRGPVFWLIALAYASVAMNHGVIITHLMPLLAERGLEPETVVLAASMIGPMQVAGRLAMIAAERHVPIIWITAAAFASMAVAALALLGTVTQPVLIVAFVVLQGAGVGINSITRPVVTAMLLGRANFGAISGMLGTVNLSAFACSPLVAAWIWQLGGYQVVITCCFVLAVIATLAIPAASAVSRRA
ncbi:MAG: MFS transporter [Pseudomonadota bacterium]|nr:MFS transporter [Pseudomonadota bacterium]